MSADEAERFRLYLAASPALLRELQQMREIGAYVRSWAAGAAARSGALLEPTLRRVREADRRRARRTTLGHALAALLVIAQPWSHHAGEPTLTPTPTTSQSATPIRLEGAAIERVEATDQRAQVFVLGASSTPVVWLTDVVDDDSSEQQGPG
jgi:hypothetical protein